MSVFFANAFVIYNFATNVLILHQNLSAGPTPSVSTDTFHRRIKNTFLEQLNGASSFFSLLVLRLCPIRTFSPELHPTTVGSSELSDRIGTELL